MSALNDRDRELVAIAASIAANCVPCIVYHIGQARSVGLVDDEIRAAIDLAAEIRKMPANQVLNTARAYLDEQGEPESSGCTTGCAQCDG